MPRSVAMRRWSIRNALVTGVARSSENKLANGRRLSKEIRVVHSGRIRPTRGVVAEHAAVGDS